MAVAQPHQSASDGETERLRRDLTVARNEIGSLRKRAERAETLVRRLQSSRALRLAALRRQVNLRVNPLQLIREAWRIIRVKETPGMSAAIPVPKPSRTTAIRQAMQAGDYDRALALIRRGDATYARDQEFLRLKRDTLYRRGELSAALRVSQQLRRINNSAEVRKVERFMVGRMVETEPSWLPRIPGAKAQITPAADNVVLHLLKESIPYHNNGFCMRSHYSLLSQQAAGFEPVVVTSPGFPRRDGHVDFPTVETIDGIAHHRIELGYASVTDVPYDDYLRDYAWAAARVVRSIRPALIHAGSGYRGYESALVGIALKSHFNLPFVYEVRSFFEATWTGDSEWAERGEYYGRRFEAENRCMRAADAVITIADAMRDEIIARGVPADRIFVVPNGVEASVFTPRPRSLELVRKLGIEGFPTFGYVSNLDHFRESQETLIRAMAVLKSRGLKARCLIVGDGRRRPELEVLAKQMRVTDSVIFAGKVPHSEIQDYYTLLDVFVVPRVDERAARLVTPLKPYEAMALAIPCVVSDLPALREITGNDERGLRFPPGDERALAERLQRLFEDAPLRQHLGQVGREWVVRERSWKANGPRYAQAYAAAIDVWKMTGGSKWK